MRRIPLTRKEIDKLTDFVKTYRAKGLAFTRLTAEAESSSYEKFLTEEEKTAIRTALGRRDRAMCSSWWPMAKTRWFSTAWAPCAAIWPASWDLIQPGTFDFLWVTDFPLFEYERRRETGLWRCTIPSPPPSWRTWTRWQSDLGAVYARAYDMVLNGTRGGRRFHPDQRPGHSEQDVLGAWASPRRRRRSGSASCIDAFKYGAPPHGGMAYGLDRLVMLMLGKDSIRDVIAFPKVQNSSELMTMCPSAVEEKNLRELSIAVTATEEE